MATLTSKTLTTGSTRGFVTAPSSTAEATVILEQALAAPSPDDAELLKRARQLRAASRASIASHEAFQRMVDEGRP